MVNDHNDADDNILMTGNIHIIMMNEWCTVYWMNDHYKV